MCADAELDGSHTLEYGPPLLDESQLLGSYDEAVVAAGAGGPYGIGSAGGIIGIIDIGICIPDFDTNWKMMKPRTNVIANLERMRAFIALIPTIPTMIGIKAFIFSFNKRRIGKRSFFFKR